MSPRKPRVPGRPVARFSNVLEAIGTVLVLAWAVFSFIDGHPVLGTILALVGLGLAYTTVREFSGKGLGRAPQPGEPTD